MLAYLGSLSNIMALYPEGLLRIAHAVYMSIFHLAPGLGKKCFRRSIFYFFFALKIAK